MKTNKSKDIPIREESDRTQLRIKSECGVLGRLIAKACISDGYTGDHHKVYIPYSISSLVRGTANQVIVTPVALDDSIILSTPQDIHTGATPTFDGMLLTDFIRSTGSSLYRRYYHLPIASFDPGASGASWVSPDADHLGGWRLNASGDTLEFDTDVHNDWDESSDLEIEIYFQLYAAGNPGDTVDIKIECYYMGEGDSSTKSQTIEVATVTDGTQYKMYKASFTIDYDAVGNVIEKEDILAMILNLETDTSEIDDILVVHASYNYNTTHVGIESGDT